jgi:hypothetical protein
MKQQYIERRFNAASQSLIETIDGICDDYTAQGFVLTVRQLYYQLVARNIIPNNERSYKNTTSLVNDARLAGLLDWDAIEDRTREFTDRPHWDDGSDFVRNVAPQFFTDMWREQEYRVFVIVEKEALAGVLQKVCRKYDVPLLAARGYPSVSVLREFAQERVIPCLGEQRVRIIHLGDHDPSGIDMTRDLIDRIELLSGGVPTHLDRVALNMEQIEENNCPPNPAKLTDSRCGGYIKKFGYESWELDALEPKYLVKLVENNITKHINYDIWSETNKFIEETRDKLIDMANAFEGAQDE